MTWITIDNVQRALTPKTGVVLVFCKLYHGDIHLHKIPRKYLEQFSSYRVDTNILQKSLFSKFKGPKLQKQVNQSYRSCVLHLVS